MKKTIVIAAIALVLVCIAAAAIVPGVISANRYEEASALFDGGMFEEAAAAFEALGDYKDAPAKNGEALRAASYETAAELLSAGNYQAALSAFEAAGGYSDARSQASELKERVIPYANAQLLFDGGKYQEASSAFGALGGYLDSALKKEEAENHIRYNEADAALKEGWYFEAYDLFGALDGFLDSADRQAEADDALWDIAKSKATSQAYDEYLLLSENSAHREEASKERERVYGLEQSAKASAAFDSAISAGTIPAINSFLSEWGGSPYMDAGSAKSAQDRIAELKADGSLSASILGNPNSATSDMINAFLRDFPGHKDEEKIKSLSKGDFLSLVSADVISVKVTGSSIDFTKVAITSKASRDLTVTLPIGTYFAANSSSVQNMVLREPQTVTLRANNSTTLSVKTACMNISRDIPESSDGFSAKTLSASAKLAKVIALCHEKKASYAVTQAAVWIVTDNPGDYDLLNTLVYSNGSKAISADDLAKAKAIVKEAV